MADEPTINLSVPPAEPVDVQVSPSAPPALPFDVPIVLDDPPAAPFDVPTFPDGPPAVPFDVSVTLSPSPGAPVDVATFPDGPPREPTDVALTPDDPPIDPVDVTVTPSTPPSVPIDVPTLPDLPPAIPFDVSTTPDASPSLPVDVPTTPDGPPIVPFDVATTPDGPPSAPFDVAITPSSPPAAPFDVPIFPDLPAVQIPGQPGDTPTIDQLINSVMRFDRTLGTFLETLVEIQPVSVNGPGGGALDPTLLAAWFRDYTQAVGQNGPARFIAEQSVLYAMNPTVARVFDPTYFLKMLIPGSMGHVRTALDVELGVTLETVARARDEILQARISLTPDRPAGDGRSDGIDIYGPENKYTEGQAFSVDSMVDTIMDKGSFANVPLILKPDGAGGHVARFDASELFEDRRPDGASLTKGTARLRATSGAENVSNSRLARSAGLDGVIRASLPGEQEDGTVLSTTQDPSDVVDDDDARVPLAFTDLRKDPVKNAYRSVYFRPMNLGFSTTISPEYSDQTAFGRTDAIVGYQKTTRNFSVSFEVVAFAVEDLQVMYNKMTWLSSMCYPSYGSDSLMRSGPVCRMRIGDAVSTGAGGLSGVIRSLGFDFAEAMWELRKGMKVPRSFKVTLDFMALHEGPVGLLNGAFGVLQLPPGGSGPDRNTNFSGGPTDSRSAGLPEGASVLPGRFARFGESRRK